MLVLIIAIAIVIIIALGLVLVVGKALGPPQLPPKETGSFDDTPADVRQLDVKP